MTHILQRMYHLAVLSKGSNDLIYASYRVVLVGFRPFTVPKDPGLEPDQPRFREWFVGDDGRQAGC